MTDRGRRPRGSLREWRRVFDAVYAERAASGNVDLRGWVNPVTGQSFEADHLEHWLGDVVELALSLQPTRVLELGAGSGNLAQALAPFVERYIAVDISPRAIQALRERIDAERLTNVAAHKLDALAAVAAIDDPVDLVVVNSVSQYFPDEEYAERVMAGAWACVKPRGSVLIGDVRNAALLQLEHAYIEAARRGAEATPAGVAARVAKEAELLLPPSFFRAAARRHHVTAVPLLKPRGETTLGRFRYDVVLCSTPHETKGLRRLNWHEDVTPSTVEQLGQPPLVIEDVPNHRFGQRARQLASLPATTGGDPFDPSEWTLAAAAAGRVAHVVWRHDTNDGTYDVVITDRRGRGFDPTGALRRAVR